MSDKPGYNVAGIFALAERECEIKHSDPETLISRGFHSVGRQHLSQHKGAGSSPGGWKKRLSWDEGKDVIVRGRDEKRCEEGERNVVQRRETVRDRDTHADTDNEKGAERERQTKRN